MKATAPKPPASRKESRTHCGVSPWPARCAASNGQAQAPDPERAVFDVAFWVGPHRASIFQLAGATLPARCVREPFHHCARSFVASLRRSPPDWWAGGALATMQSVASAADMHNDRRSHVAERLCPLVLAALSDQQIHCSVSQRSTTDHGFPEIGWGVFTLPRQGQISSPVVKAHLEHVAH